MLPLYIADFSFSICNQIVILLILTMRLKQIVLLSALNNETPKARGEREDTAINSSNKILLETVLGSSRTSLGSIKQSSLVISFKIQNYVYLCRTFWHLKV